MSEATRYTIFFVLSFVTFTAVSYTHLDVYKRQLQRTVQHLEVLFDAA